MMKKIILSLLLITTVLLSVGCDEKIEDYISKDYCNYEFTKNNPHLFMDMYNILFVSDLNSVKGKILKKEYLEYEIYKQFNNLVGDKTAFYISHRLSSCKFCDKIAELVAANKVDEAIACAKKTVDNTIK